MKILRYRSNGEASYGILDDDESIRELTGSPFDSLDTSGAVAHLDQVTVLAPVESPRIIGVGLNYVAHAHEAGKPLPTNPMLFMKPTPDSYRPGRAYHLSSPRQRGTLRVRVGSHYRQRDTTRLRSGCPRPCGSATPVATTSASGSSSSLRWRWAVCCLGRGLTPSARSAR